MQNWQKEDHTGVYLYSKNYSYKGVTLFFQGPTQQNNYDCGIYTLSAVDCVIQHWCKYNSLYSFKIPNLTPFDCIKKISYLAYIVVNGYILPKNVILTLMTKPITQSLNELGKHQNKIIRILNDSIKLKLLK